MIYECTDCKHCANFCFGLRVFCLHPDLPPDEVLKYQPCGDRDAETCAGFDDSDEIWFSWDQLMDAEAYSQEKHGEITYEGIREWCEQNTEKGAQA